MSDRYDAGLLNDYGGGNVAWWRDYMRAELERSHDHYTEQIEHQAAEITRLRTELEAERTVTLGQAADIARMAQQLAVAREGLEKITDYKEIAWPEHYEAGWNDGRGDAADIARDTFAKLD